MTLSHIDTTSMLVHGAYAVEDNSQIMEGIGLVHFYYGSSLTRAVITNILEGPQLKSMG